MVKVIVKALGFVRRTHTNMYVDRYIYVNFSQLILGEKASGEGKEETLQGAFVLMVGMSRGPEPWLWWKNGILLPAASGSLVGSHD